MYGSNSTRPVLLSWNTPACRLTHVPTYDTRYITAAAAGTHILFGGGFCSPCKGQNGTDRSNVVDLFDTATGLWSAHPLSQRRSNLAACSVGSRYALFAGGTTDAEGGLSRSTHVDIFDGETGMWSNASLEIGRCCLACGGTLDGGAGVCAGGIAPNIADVFSFSDSV